MRPFALLLASLVAGPASLTAVAGLPTTTPAPPAKAPAASPAQVQAQYLQLIQMQLLDQRCHWLDATARTALDATVAEREAWLLDQAVDRPGQAQLASAKAKAAAVDCASKGDAQAVRFGAWQMRVTWTLRAQALLDAPDRPQWFARQSPVQPYAKALDEALSALQARYPGSIAQARPGIQAEAVHMLASACPNAPHRCAVEDPTAHGKAYAQAWVGQATAFAGALAKDPVKLPDPPQDR